MWSIKLLEGEHTVTMNLGDELLQPYLQDGTLPYPCFHAAWAAGQCLWQ